MSKETQFQYFIAAVIFIKLITGTENRISPAKFTNKSWTNLRQLKSQKGYMRAVESKQDQLQYYVSEKKIKEKVAADEKI